MESPIITISEGKIQGTTLTNVFGNNYLAFKGIPYAQAPVGPLRFEAPQPPVKWSGVRDASKHGGDVALQYDTDDVPPEILGDEDCLYLNIYTNKIEHKRPVMFYVHGGGFVEGSGNDEYNREDYFMTQDLVLIFVNYRLGPMGFLSLGHEVASGNQGLRDVIFALKWVQRNIEAFGGDPDNITIFGNSSGSVICHLLTLLPIAKGLFHKAILQSGSVILSKTLRTGKDTKNGFRIAKMLGMDSDDPIEVVEFLRSVPASKLITLQGHILTKWDREVLFVREYEPIVDVNYTKDPIIPAPLNQLLKNNAHIPIIIGHTSNESLLNFMGHFDDLENYKFFDDNIEAMLKNLFMITEPSKIEEIIKILRDFYLENQPIEKKTAWNLIHLISDIGIIGFNRKTIDIRNKCAVAPTYFYNFSYMGNEPTYYQYEHGPQPLKGVAHGDELSYIFYLMYMRMDNDDYQFPKEGTKDRLMVERLIRMWFNFAATGNPISKVDDLFLTTVWKPSEEQNLYYLDIGDELVLKRDKDSKTRLIYEKFSKYITI